jgi:hypothetical protein
MLQKRIIITLDKCSIRPEIVLQSRNIFLDIKEHMFGVPIG